MAICLFAYMLSMLIHVVFSPTLRIIRLQEKKRSCNISHEYKKSFIRKLHERIQARTQDFRMGAGTTFRVGPHADGHLVEKGTTDDEGDFC